MTCNDHLSVALAYALRWLVLPLAWVTDDGICGCRLGAICPRPGKHPLTKNGVKDATTNLNIIEGWWARWPHANIGIRCGQVSDLFVLDVDPRHGGDETLAQLIALYGKLPRTPVCATGGGGWHYFFRYLELIELIGKDYSRFPGLDFIGDGGYVVAAPSRHHSGGVYQWLNDWRTTTLSPVPDWLLQLIRKTGKVKATPRKAGKDKAPLQAWAQAELSTEDQRIINRLEQGLVGNKYQLLVSGSWKDLYPTQSEADLALFNRLAWLVDGDPGRMYAIFKETALMRDGDSKPFGYYERTIMKAINGLNWRPLQAFRVVEGQR